MRVESYGTGTQVKLPGKSAMEPRIFKFGTPYSDMYRSLSATPEDEAFFIHNGVLELCKRGASVKVRRWNFSGLFVCLFQEGLTVLFGMKTFHLTKKSSQKHFINHSACTPKVARHANIRRTKS
jgi:hypothetical protein